MHAREGWICAVLLSLASGLAGQGGPAGQSGTPASVPSGNSNRHLTLDVVVTDKSGRAMTGLRKRDFTILDNKQPLKIASFHAAVFGSAANDPVEVVLLVDEINADFMTVARERGQIEKFLQHNGGKLSVPALMAYVSDTGVTIGRIPTEDGKALIEDLNARQAGLRDIYRAQGLEGALERMQLSLDALKQVVQYEGSKPGHKLLVWISPGWPFLENPALVDLTAREQQGLFNSLAAISGMLRQARVTLYNVDPLGTEDAAGFEASTYTSFLGPVKTAKELQYGNLGLQIIAAQSGGLVLYGNNDVEGEIAKCIADASAFYVLSFDTAPGNNPNEYHALEVGLDRPGLTPRTRTGYYAQPVHHRQ